MPIQATPQKPDILKTALADSKSVVSNYADAGLGDANHSYTGSYKYDPLSFPLKSTQQLNVDWSKFENHCFFSSAEVRVNEAFDKIINFFPFDGSKREIEAFLDSLTGFEKWVYDKFPRWSGALHFSGTQVGENGKNGTFVTVKDKSGFLYPDISKNNKGEVVLNPQDSETSITFESLVLLPAKTNDTQVVFQKSSSSSNGITFYLKPTSSTEEAVGVFSVCSGSLRNVVSGTLKKGSFNHVCLSADKDEDVLKFYVNEKLVSKSSSVVKFPILGIDSADLLLGSGSSFYSLSTLISPTQTFSGTIDEFRVYHSLKDEKTQALNIARGTYTSPDLKLYFRFNEPSGSLSSNPQSDAIVLDSSGNSLHGVVSNYSSSLRVDMTSFYTGNVMRQERKDFQVVLFPAYEETVNLNKELLVSASLYDAANPNNIIRLIPPHYLLEGGSQEGYDNSTTLGYGGSPYGGDGIPGQGKKGSVQMIMTFLYIWSRFFDELKTYIDSFVTLRTVGYDPEDTIPDNFLDDLITHYGMYLPRFFNHATVEQYAEGVNVDGLTDTDMPLKKIQAILMRRVLMNLPEVIRSKGTQHSIKSFLRSVGIDPNNSVKIREYGGSTTSQLVTSREKRTESVPLVDFTSGSSVFTTFLSASRIEPGWPTPAGSFVYEGQKRVGTTVRSDGLLTSGSWNLEALFKIPKTRDQGTEQSLFRLATTGSSPNSLGLIANIVAYHPAYQGASSSIVAYFRPGDDAINSPTMSLKLNMDSEGLFDGEKWNVSFGCNRNDSYGATVSSSYYLRAGRVEEGNIAEKYVTSSYFYERRSSEKNVLRSINTTYNPSGSFICLGPGVEVLPSLTFPFLNNSIAVDDAARSTYFTGWAGSLRFWSKGMLQEEWEERVRNPKSVGVSDPRVNYNFVNNVSGSFEKLRLETLLKQPIRNADSEGNIEFLDFSLNNTKTSTGSGFSPNSLVVGGDISNYSYLSTNFDEASTDDKVRIRSFTNQKNLEDNPGSVIAPSYLSNIALLREEPQDDLRLSLEFSMIDSLNKDIVSMFSSYELLGDILGKPENMFSPDYPELDVLRDVYFNRLSGKPDFKKFFEFYRWFDMSISSFIEQLLPAKTRFKGTNFVVESHILERHKYMYKYDENYVGKKQVVQDSLLVQQIVGSLRKY